MFYSSATIAPPPTTAPSGPTGVPPHHCTTIGQTRGVTNGDDPDADRTADGRYIVVRGRRWRATDPSIPESLRTELVRALMTGRREVKSKGDIARVMVHDAKVALGERGDPWWEPTEQGTRDRLAATIRTLLRARGQGSICPSDAARVVGGDRWRDLMGAARSVALCLRDEGVVSITRQGAPVTGAEIAGPIRIIAGDALEFRPSAG